MPAAIRFPAGPRRSRPWLLPDCGCTAHCASPSDLLFDCEACCWLMGAPLSRLWSKMLTVAGTSHRASWCCVNVSLPVTVLQADPRAALQVAKSDADVKRALRAWTCYGSGAKPADVWQESGPLQSMFSRSQAPRPAGKVPTSAQVAEGSTHELLAGSSPATAGTSCAGDSLGAEHGSQNSTCSEAPETSQQLPAAGPSTSTNMEGAGHLPAQNPCADGKAEGAGQAPAAKAKAPQTSNAFAKMMQAAKQSPPLPAKTVSSTRPAARDGWANHFKMLAANPERSAPSHDAGQQKQRWAALEGMLVLEASVASHDMVITVA